MYMTVGMSSRFPNGFFFSKKTWSIGNTFPVLRVIFFHKSSDSIKADIRTQTTVPIGSA